MICGMWDNEESTPASIWKNNMRHTSSETTVTNTCFGGRGEKNHVFVLSLMTLACGDDGRTCSLQDTQPALHKKAPLQWPRAPSDLNWHSGILHAFVLSSNHPLPFLTMAEMDWVSHMTLKVTLSVQPFVVVLVCLQCALILSRSAQDLCNSNSIFCQTLQPSSLWSHQSFANVCLIHYA